MDEFPKQSVAVSPPAQGTDRDILVYPVRIPQVREHIRYRPRKGERTVLEWIDFPHWRKHHLVERLARENGRHKLGFVEIVDYLYSLDETLARRAWLNQDELNVGFILATLGLSNVTVIPLYCQLRPDDPSYTAGIKFTVKEGRRERPYRALWASGEGVWHTRYMVTCLHFNEPAHWTTMIWDEEAEELYLYDALYEKRDTRIAISVEAWAARRRKEGKSDKFVAICPTQTAQGVWECGLLAIANVFNFFRPPSTVSRAHDPSHQWRSAHRVGNWTLDGMDHATKNEQLDKLVNFWRATIYNFFGNPINIPLNPFHPLTIGLPDSTLKAGASEWKFLWEENFDASKPVLEELRKDAEAVRNQAGHLERLGRVSKSRDTPLLTKEQIKAFLLAPSFEAGKLMLPNLDNAQRAYNPYRVAADGGAVQWPFPFFLGTDQWESRSSAPPPKHPVPAKPAELFPPKTPSKAVVPFKGFSTPADQPPPPIDTPEPFTFSPEARKKSEPPYYNPTPSKPSKLAKPSRSPTHEPPSDRPVHSASHKKAPSTVKKRRRTPGAPPKSLKPPSRPPSRQSQRTKERPPSRRSQRIRGQPQSQPASDRQRLPPWMPDYERREFRDRETGEVFTPTMTNMFTESVWAGLKGRARERYELLGKQGN